MHLGTVTLSRLQIPEHTDRWFLYSGRSFSTLAVPEGRVWGKLMPKIGFEHLPHSSADRGNIVRFRHIKETPPKAMLRHFQPSSGIKGSVLYPHSPHFLFPPFTQNNETKKWPKTCTPLRVIAVRPPSTPPSSNDHIITHTQFSQTEHPTTPHPPHPPAPATRDPRRHPSHPLIPTPNHADAC